MTKRIALALEKVFDAEIRGLLPYCSKRAIYRELLEDGLVEEIQGTFGAGERFAVTVTGYALTIAGNLAYCEWAAGQDAVDPAPGTA